MKKKRLTSFILSLALTVSSFASVPFGEIKAKADPADEPEIIEIDNFDDFYEALTSEGDFSILLTGDIEKTIGNNFSINTGTVIDATSGSTVPIGQSGLDILDPNAPQYEGPDGNTGSTQIPYLITVGKGIKSISLDGYDIDISYPNVDDHWSALFYIGQGAELILTDDTNDSEVFYDGYISACSDWDDTASPLNRDIFIVCGGNLTLNGGTYTAGRSKLERGFTAINSFEIDNNSDYTGSATKLLCGTAIEVSNDGNVTINKAKILGRGLDYFPSNNDFTSVKNAAIEVGAKGNITINEAYVIGKSGASCLKTPSLEEDRGECKINCGKFELHRNDTVFCGGKDIYVIDPSPSFGYFGIPDYACENWNRVQVDYSFKEKSGTCPGSNSLWRDYAEQYVENKSRISDYSPSIRIYPRTLDFLLESEADPDAGSDPALVDPSLTETDPLLFHAYDRDWLFDFIPYYVQGYDGWKSTQTYTLYDSDFNTIKLTDNKIVYGHNEGDGYIEFNLEDHMDTSLLEYGKTYYLVCELKEEYHGASSYSVSSLGCATFIPTHLEKPVVLSIDDKAMAGAKGEKVTLHASARNARGAYWEKRSYNEGSTTIPCTSFEVVNGVAYATLEVEPECMAYYHCFFVNNVGYTATMGTYVDYVPSFRKTQDEAFTLYNGSDLTISQPIDHTIDEMEGSDTIIKVEWWKIKADGTESKVTSGLYADINGTNLTLSGRQSNAAKYYAKVYNKNDPEKTTHTSPVVTVVYSDEEQPPKYITKAEIYGMDDLHIGDLAPTVEDLYTPDPRFMIKKITWTGTDANGYIVSPNPTYTIDLASKQIPTYMFKYDSEGTFVWTMDGATHYSYDSADYGTPGVTITYTYDNYTYLTPPSDRVIFDKSAFSVEKGEEVDILLGISVETNQRFVRLGETHTLTSLALTDASLPLPAGLSLVKESNGYHIKGTVAADSGTINTSVTAVLSNGDSWGQGLYFYILPDPAEISGQQEDISESYHAMHMFVGDWVDAENGTHVRGCMGCNSLIAEEHVWDDGEILTEATEETDGTILYTCSICGATKTESTEYTEKNCTVTFDPNDGVNEAVVFNTTEGVVMSLPENPFPSNGKVFDGWSIGQPGDKIVINGNTYISACWNDGRITVNKQPKDVIAKTGDTAKFTFSVSSNYTLSYQWQVSTDNGLSWKNSSLSGNKTKTLSVGATAARSDYLFRCIVSDRNGNTITSSPARLLATTEKPAIVTQPLDRAVSLGDTAYFTINAGNYDKTPVTYQWQVSKDGGESWNNSGLTGNKTNTLTVAATAARAGYRFRCVVTSGTKKITSKSARLYVIKDAIALSIQPVDINATEDTNAKFSVSASSTTNSTLSYQWQVSTDGGKNWSNSGLTGNKTRVLTVKATAARDGYLFRCKITDENGYTVTTSKAALTVISEAIKISKQPADLEKYAGETARFTVKAASTQGYSLSYQWQAQTPGGEWKNSGLKGNKTATLSLEATEGRDGYKFRCVITDSKENTVTSDEAELTVIVIKN